MESSHPIMIMIIGTGKSGLGSAVTGGRLCMMPLMKVGNLGGCGEHDAPSESPRRGETR